MKTRTVKSLVGATVVAMLLCAGSATALAGTLLSGYGGPGEGSQAILGAGLVNLPSGRGPSGGARALAPSPSSGASPTAAGRQGAHGKGTDSSSARPQRTSAGAGRSSGSGAAHTLGAATAQGTAVGSQALGLSGSDLLYVLLALAALVLTALLTRQLTHGTEGGAHD